MACLTPLWQILPCKLRIAWDCPPTIPILYLYYFTVLECSVLLLLRLRLQFYTEKGSPSKTQTHIQWSIVNLNNIIITSQTEAKEKRKSRKRSTHAVAVVAVVGSLVVVEVDCG